MEINKAIEEPIAPKIGDTTRGRFIGKIGNNCRYIWQACEVCGEERWVLIYATGRVSAQRCRKCWAKSIVGINNYRWKGGRYTDKRGYICIRLSPDDFFYPMARDNKGYVWEHRLVVAKALGRNLHSWEIVHHKGVKYPKGSKEDKADNRYPENLQLVSEGQHNQITIMERRIHTLEIRVTLLEAENVLLGGQISDYRKQISRN